VRRIDQGPLGSKKLVVQAMGELGPEAAGEVGPCLLKCLKDPSIEVVHEAIAATAAWNGALTTARDPRELGELLTKERV
jgi:hypothetical protein